MTPTRRRPAASGHATRRRRPVPGVANPRRRARTMLIAGLFVLTVFGGQLLRVQAFDASAVANAAQERRLTSTVIPASRGEILDSNGVVLASSVERKTVSVDQTAVPTYERKLVVDGKRKDVTVGVVGAAQQLAPLLGTTPDKLVTQLTGTARYRVLAKGVTPLVWRQIDALGIPGVYAETTTQRVYPEGPSTASLVGFTQADGTPASGVEFTERSVLNGTPGKQVGQRGASGEPIPWAQDVDTPAVPGQDVTLTIDADLQWYAQNQIASVVQSSGAISGYAVVMEVATGKLRAVASYPTFDPSDPGAATAFQRQNHAFEDVYEPGSTGKVMSIATALEEKKITPTTPLIVPNRLPRAGESFKDDEDHPTLDLTVAGALAMSSNIGTMLATEGVAPADMEASFRKFGIGSASGSGLYGESPGIFAKASDWSGTKRYTTLFGQGYSVTAIQAAGVYQTLANGGVRVPPTLVESTTAPDGTVTQAPQPQGVRVVSQQTATQMSQMLEEVVGPHGTAPKAKIDGYRVAGKTGTANRYDPAVGGYSGYTASFIGYAPADAPKYVVAVTLQKPVHGHFGGMLGAPVFQKVMSYLLQKHQIAPSGQAAPVIPLSSDSGWDPNDPAVLDGTKRKQ
ncbi:peptidoglycan D,D-transpeptidase FtsI family protein [Lapillicoccus jejuensis]|uniref:Peptidoglycan synthetase FtsI n=1 Tax=Lapillicoccus jejuensis TaxID=402171 RepID=A0A542E6R9_9MICO|nr:penicillin-binding protein 2 [Lapillicoccus jejuensis]TQJ11033.1 peptidoglycan synthetase FtsI [Lapillicoccus jejuensis]